MNSIAAAKPIRRYELDWLRLFAILLVFVYHSAHFFDLDDWSVKNATTYPWLSWLMALLAQWGMPLIFVISGASLFFATRRAGAGRFLGDKVQRLLLPLLVGVFTFSPLQVYLERLSHGQFQGTFWQFLPHYFEGIYVPGGEGNFAFHGMHLWYLLVLFLLTLLFMPLFWWFRGARGSKVLRRLGDLLALPGAIVLLAVPTVVLQNITNTGALGGTFTMGGGWRPVQYLWFFLGGYLILSHEGLQRRIVQARWVCLGLTALLAVLPLLLHTGPGDHPDITAWPGLLAILGFAMKHLGFGNRFLAYSSEAVLPFYILHQNVLLWVGFFVVTWPIPDLAKYLLIALSSLLLVMLLYEYLVRRANVLRLLFGMRPLRRAALSDDLLPATQSSG
jgi:glucan biosynthesis protein C